MLTAFPLLAVASLILGIKVRKSQYLTVLCYVLPIIDVCTQLQVRLYQCSMWSVEFWASQSMFFKKRKADTVVDVNRKCSHHGCKSLFCVHLNNGTKSSVWVKPTSFSVTCLFFIFFIAWLHPKKHGWVPEQKITAVQCAAKMEGRKCLWSHDLLCSYTFPSQGNLMKNLTFNLCVFNTWIQ